MVRDLNGYERKRSRIGSLVAKLVGLDRHTEPLDNPASAQWRTVAECYDDAAAASTVLEKNAVDTTKQSVLVHIFRIDVPSQPSVSGDDDRSRQIVAALTAGAEAERYCQVSPGSLPGFGSDRPELLAVGRVQTVDALHISQERSRMAGLASRVGGVAIGWQVRQ